MLQRHGDEEDEERGADQRRIANGRVSAKPISIKSAISIGPRWLKSCGRHSLMRDRFSIPIRWNGKMSASTP